MAQHYKLDALLERERTMGAMIIKVGFTILLLFILCLPGCNDPECAIVIKEPSPVYEDYPEGGPPTSKVIAVLEKGERKEVIHTRWSKDCEWFKVRLKDGRIGYVGWNAKFSIEPYDKGKK